MSQAAKQIGMLLYKFVDSSEKLLCRSRALMLKELNEQSDGLLLEGRYERIASPRLSTDIAAFYSRYTPACVGNG